MRIPILNNAHEEAGARISDFAGWRLPIDYGSVVLEVNAVRKAAGLFDVSHMGRLKIWGSQALPTLQRLLTNDVARLDDGAGQYTIMCNPEGGVKDDLIIFRNSTDSYDLVVNASNLDKDKAWISEHLNGAEISDRTQETVLIALQGPRSTEIISKAGFPEASDLRRFHFTHTEIAGCQTLVSRTGYTGEDGFEIECAARDGESLWHQLLATGKEFGLILCGLAARDVLRIEAGLSLYGHEINEHTGPVEAGLMRYVKLDKGSFFGREIIARIADKGTQQKLIGIVMEERAVPRAGDEVHYNSDIGKVTSGTFSPTLGCGIAMAYLPASAELGQSVEVIIHGKSRLGILKKLPLYLKNK